MGGFGCLFSLIAGFFWLIGLLPFLGWINWFTTLPAAIIAIIFSGLALSRGENSSGARWGLIAGIFLFFLATFRLSLGFGIL
jgi:hypothetical protein